MSLAVGSDITRVQDTRTAGAAIAVERPAGAGAVTAGAGSSGMSKINIPSVLASVARTESKACTQTGDDAK